MQSCMDAALQQEQGAHDEGAPSYDKGYGEGKHRVWYCDSYPDEDASNDDYQHFLVGNTWRGKLLKML